MFAGTLPIFASILDAKILLVLEPKLQSWKIVHEGELLSRNMAGLENLIENLLSAMGNHFQVYLEAALKIQNLRTHNNCDACTFLKFKIAYPRWEIELRIVTFVIGRWITKILTVGFFSENKSINSLWLLVWMPRTDSCWLQEKAYQNTWEKQGHHQQDFEN